MRSFAISAFSILAAALALPSQANAAAEDAKEHAARKACLTGNYQKGVEILSDLYLKTKDPVFIYNQGRCMYRLGQ